MCRNAEHRFLVALKCDRIIEFYSNRSNDRSQVGGRDRLYGGVNQQVQRIAYRVAATMATFDAH